jgi:hypothetical protein
VKLKLAVAFVLLNALDIALTLQFIWHGTGRELNPVMASVLTLPVSIVVAYKVLVPAFFMVMLLILSRLPVLHWIKWNLILISLTALETGICLFNTAGLIGR